MVQGLYCHSRNQQVKIMTTKKSRCFNSNKSNETIKVDNVNDFPINKEVQQFINTIKSGVEQLSLCFSPVCFCRFTDEKQKAIVSFYNIKLLYYNE